MLSLFMANDYFRFQKFTVWQELTAMKVCTDACLFGAWASGFLPGAARVLDIGAGTGLLSLMLAQKTQARIDSVEVDADAVLQAEKNFSASPWRERLRVVRGRIQDYASEEKYDLIISNPPFYSNDLKSADHKRNLALHGDGLSFESLVFAVKKLLAPRGRFAVLVPAHRAEELQQIAGKAGLYAGVRVNVRQTLQHPFFRVMFLFYDRPALLSESEMAIKDNFEKYTPAFSELLKDYYLVPDNALQ